MRWLSQDIAHVSPIIYRKRLNSLVTGINKLRIKQDAVHDNQLFEKLKFGVQNIFNHFVVDPLIDLHKL
jgi:hypothetical protein